MSPVLLAKLQRLADAGVELVPASGVTTHFFFTRDGYVALAERHGEDFGSIGAAGLLVEGGYAALVNGEFVLRGARQPASEEQVQTLRAFERDLARALQ